MFESCAHRIRTVAVRVVALVVAVVRAHPCLRAIGVAVVACVLLANPLHGVRQVASGPVAVGSVKPPIPTCVLSTDGCRATQRWFAGLPETTGAHTEDQQIAMVAELTAATIARVHPAQASFKATEVANTVIADPMCVQEALWPLAHAMAATMNTDDLNKGSTLAKKATTIALRDMVDEAGRVGAASSTFLATALTETGEAGVGWLSSRMVEGRAETAYRSTIDCGDQ